mgnify:CR=1 FL=1
MYYAAVSRCPSFGGSVKNYDEAKAITLPGLLNVFQISNGVAVVADSTWHAFNGRDALNIQWDLGPNAKINSRGIHNELVKKSKTEGYEFESRGDVSKDIEGEKILEAVYEVPFITHAPMEPMNCVAKYENGKAELWVPTQNPQNARSEVAKALGISEDNVTVHVTLMGGGFGRRLISDFAVEAAEISK